MFFLVWLYFHCLGLLMSRLLVARNPAYERPSWETIGTNLLWYSIPCLWFWDRTEPSVGEFTAGFVTHALGWALLIAARRANPYFRPEIVMPPKVIRHGVYRLRHPGYLAFTMLGLSSLWLTGGRTGYFPLLLYAFLLMLRAQEEDRLLRAHS